MFQHLYVAEKLKELEREIPRRDVASSVPGVPSRGWLRRPAAAIGRRIRGAGEALESWGQPCPDQLRS